MVGPCRTALPFSQAQAAAKGHKDRCEDGANALDLENSCHAQEEHSKEIDRLLGTSA